MRSLDGRMPTCLCFERFAARMSGRQCADTRPWNPANMRTAVGDRAGRLPDRMEIRMYRSGEGSAPSQQPSCWVVSASFNKSRAGSCVILPGLPGPTDTLSQVSN